MQNNKLQSFKLVKLVFIDFDGILSKCYTKDREGNKLKTINAGNVEAVNILHNAGMRVICLSADSTLSGRTINENECAKLGIEYYSVGTYSKLNVISDICKQSNDFNFVYVGDDACDVVISRFANITFMPVACKAIVNCFKPGNDFIEYLHSDKPLLEVALKLCKDFTIINNAIDGLELHELISLSTGTHFESHAQVMEYLKREKTKCAIRYPDYVYPFTINGMSALFVLKPFRADSWNKVIFTTNEFFDEIVALNPNTTVKSIN